MEQLAAMSPDKTKCIHVKYREMVSIRQDDFYPRHADPARQRRASSRQRNVPDPHHNAELGRKQHGLF